MGQLNSVCSISVLLSKRGDLRRPSLCMASDRPFYGFTESRRNKHCLKTLKQTFQARHRPICSA